MTERCSYRYIEQLTPAFKPIALAFGSAFHDAVGFALMHPGTSRDDIAGVFRDHLTLAVESSEVPVLFDNDEDLGTLIDAGLKMLDCFFQKVAMPERVMAVE